MLARKFRTALALTTALSLGFAASPALAQSLVNAGDLASARNSAGQTGTNVLTVSNPNSTTANIAVKSPVVVAEWNSFSVPQNTTLNISNASTAPTASLLNRVLGPPTFIGGTINASNVNLWVLNTNGMFFGANASVNANSFFASTLDTTNADFFDFF